MFYYFPKKIPENNTLREEKIRHIHYKVKKKNNQSYFSSWKKRNSFMPK